MANRIAGSFLESRWPLRVLLKLHKPLLRGACATACGHAFDRTVCGKGEVDRLAGLHPLFLTDLDATFPAIDVPGEWDAYSGKAELAGGEVPKLTVYAEERDLFGAVFSEAEKIARSVDGGGRRVAVLCASEEQFDLYLGVAKGQFEGRHLPIVSREPSSELRHAGKRFIFSMPEYVAGLQFDTVFLIHVDATEAPADSGDGVRRRFISNIYLGSSRAEKSLRISSCLSRSGKSDILDMALARQSLVEIAAPIPKRKRS